MSFTAYDIHEWLDAANVPHRLLRADGDAWTSEGGLAAVELTGASIDSRDITEGSLFVGVEGERVHGAEFLGVALENGARAALLENQVPGVEGCESPVFLVEDGRRALASMAHAYIGRFTQTTIIGITGSNGKTTTKDFTRAALAETHVVGANPGNLNSSWGLPVAVLGQSGDEDVLVLEMGASSPGEIAHLAAIAGPDVGCITNIGEAHLENFGTVSSVLKTKAALVEALPKEGCAVLPRDDDHYFDLQKRVNSERSVSFGTNPRSDIQLERCEQRSDGLHLRINGVKGKLPVFGEMNGYNAAAACAIALELGVEVHESLPRICSTRLSPHRSLVRRIRGRIVIDDSYNANPESMEQALRSLAKLEVRGRRIAVLGSMAELGERSAQLHTELIQSARELGIDQVIPVGEEMTRAVGIVYRGEGSINPGDAISLGRMLAAKTEAGDAVLFKASRSVGLERSLNQLMESLTTREEA